MKHCNDGVRVVFAVPSLANEYLGVGLLSACLNKRGVNDVVVSSYDLADIRRKISGGKRCVLAFSIVASFADKAAAAARGIRDVFPDVVIVAGGPYVTFVPEMIMRYGFDAVCIGEGEEAFPEFVERYQDSGGIPIDVKSWWVKDRCGDIHKNSLRPPVADLDSLPFPRRYVHRGVRRDIRHFIFSRGCPYGCSFCSSPRMPSVYGLSFAQYYRVRTPTSAVAEIKSVLTWSKASLVAINDSVFGLNRDWLEEFSLLYKQSRLPPFYCNAEVRQITKPYVSLLKEAGCCCVFLGFETAMEGLRRKVLCKDFTNAEFFEAVDLLRSQRIGVGIYDMIGIPGFSLDNDLETYDINREVKPDIVYPTPFVSFPGTMLGDQLLKTREGNEENKNLHVSALRKRLSCVFMFGIFSGLPSEVVRFLIRLPLMPLYRFFAFVATKISLKRLQNKTSVH